MDRMHVQTDWAIAAMNFRVAPDGGAPDTATPVQVPLTEVGSKLGMNSSSKLYGTFIPVEVPDGTRAPRGISGAAPGPPRQNHTTAPLASPRP